MRRIPKLLRIALVAIAFANLGALLTPTPAASAGGCFQECDGVNCRLDFTSLTQCDEESPPEMCSNFRCSLIPE